MQAGFMQAWVPKAAQKDIDIEVSDLSWIADAECLCTLAVLQVEPKVQKLYDYIRERGTILPINDYNQELLSQDDVHKRVIESIRSGMLLSANTSNTSECDSP